MSDSQHRGVHNPDLDVADFAGGGVLGRGTGMTIKQIKQKISQWFKKKKMPSHQWRTLEQKQALIKKQDAKKPVGEKPVSFQSARQHLPGGGKIRLKKFPDDVWRRL